MRFLCIQSTARRPRLKHRQFCSYPPDRCRSIGLCHVAIQGCYKALSDVRADGGSAGRRNALPCSVWSCLSWRPTRAAGLSLAPRRYCNVHGYDGHIGRQRRVMTQTNIASPGTYSQPQLSAIYRFTFAGSSVNL